MRLIQKHEVPHDTRVTYAIFVCGYRPQKEEKEQTWITVGGDRLDYQGEVSTKTEGLATIKLLLNSVIYLAGAIFMTADVKTSTSTHQLMIQSTCSYPSNSSKIKYEKNTMWMNLSTTDMFMFK